MTSRKLSSHEFDASGFGVLQGLAGAPVPPRARHLPGMSANLRKLLVLSLTTTAMLLSWQRADAATILWVGHCGNVAGYPTIQAAINAASAGDTIKVCPGIYIENVTINKASLTVMSTGGAAVTRVLAAQVASVVTITQPNASLVGFTLTPAGSAAKYDIGVNVNIGGNASAEIAHNVIRGGRIGVNLGCASSGSTVYHNNVRGATETGINIDTCEIPPEYPGSTFNSVHHNTVCGGLYPYSIAGGQGSDFNSVHHNTARWITFFGDGNIVHNNTAQLFNIWPGNPANVTFNNTVAAVCP
jgi:hypothetical protein